jgi:hypothetical protein
MKIEIIIIGMLLVFLSGCVSSNVYPGTFRYEKDKSQSFELRADGTYIWNPGNPARIFKGTYVRKGDKVEISSILGNVRIMTITDKGLVDVDGELWARVPNS